jgi:hypothetical protein
VELLGRLIWLSKKRKERNNKGKSKGMVQNHKKRSKRRKVKEGNQKLARPISLPSFFFVFGKQHLHIWCAQAF